MKAGQRLWTRDELILLMNLYCKLPFGKMNHTNSLIIQLAELIERTPSSVTLKLSNLASFDPSLRARGVRGAVNASKLDREIWDEFYQNWDNTLIQSEALLAEKNNSTIEKNNHIDLTNLPNLDKPEPKRKIANKFVV